MTQATLLSLVALLVFAPTAAGQDTPEEAIGAQPDVSAGATNELELLAYRPLHATAEELVDAVGQRFSRADGVRFSVAIDGRILLLRMPPGIRPEVVKLLEELDRPPQVVTIEALGGAA